MAGSLYKQAVKLLRCQKGAPEEPQLHALLFPLAVRVDGGLALLRREPEPSWHLGRRHAMRVRELLDEGRDDGDLWACWALWCRLVGEPEKKSETHAIHRGAEAVIREVFSQFQADGLCPELAV